jgi:hypothetical protein
MFAYIRSNSIKGLKKITHFQLSEITKKRTQSGQPIPLSRQQQIIKYPAATGK